MSFVDLHCHLLPGLDDGAPSLTETIAHTRRLQADGVGDVVCTPHVKRLEFPGVAVREIAARTAAAQRAVAHAGLRVRLHPGGELAHPDALELTADELALIAQGPAGARWVLLECPFAGLDEAFAAACARLTGLGYGLLLAHPERVRGIGASGLEGLRALLAGGARAQVNVCSLLGRHGVAAEATGVALIRAGLACCVASDGHPGSREHTVRLGFELARRAGIGRSAARRLTHGSPLGLLRLGMPRAAPAAHAA
ncbi:MAG: protein-tyrosine phosphatase [Solirubrobacteraceae bacterium]|nr:protein-tyrosine phosphatase [Solirubrobacteraceae bacterium]